METEKLIETLAQSSTRVQPLDHPVRRTVLWFAASIAYAALAAFVLGLRPDLPDASIMVLVWQLGSVALLSGCAALLGRRLLHWPAREGLLASRN